MNEIYVHGFNNCSVIIIGNKKDLENQREVSYKEAL